MAPEPRQSPVIERSDPLAFIKELATYYMDFLETDFHRRKTPKRNIRLRNADNLLICLNLARYPSFVQAAWKVILSGFSRETIPEIRKGAFRTAFPGTLLQVIKLEVDKLSDQQIDELRSMLGADLVQASRANRADYDKALTLTMEALRSRIRSSLLSPLMSHIRKPLERLDLGDDTALIAIEQELSDLVEEPARTKISELVQKIITDTPVELGQELRSLFQLDAIRPQLMDFFSNLGVGDLFLELFELERNRSILDKQGFYLYFCDIAYEGSKYPIFYIPFSTSVQENRLHVEFGAQVYLNKRAVEYIVQQENERSGRKGTLRCTADRIVYLAEQQAQFSQFISAATTELANFFQLDGQLDLQNPLPQVAKSTSVRITNACYIALFDNGDEALINDYEQILQLLGGDADSSIAGAFKGLIDDFIHRNPDSVAAEIQEEWDALGVPERLVYESPVPLNSEQRQILLALQKDRCKYITVEGPPGTGKSHTITAIICNIVLNNQSVLVLSDKKEALDVVEEKIILTLNRVRKDKKFQNPILRLGSTGSTYAQILSAGVMEDIKTYYRAVKKQHDLPAKIASTCAGLREDIEAEALSYGDIAMSTVREWAALESNFNSDSPLDFREILVQDDAVGELEALYSVTKALSEFGGVGLPVSSVLVALGFAEIDGIDALLKFFTSAVNLSEIIDRIVGTYPGASNDLSLIRTLSTTDIPPFSALLQRFAALRKPLIGYRFAGRALAALDQEFRVLFRFASPDAPHTRLADLGRIRSIVQGICSEVDRLPTPICGDAVSLCQKLLTDPELRSFLGRIVDLSQGAQRLRGIFSKYPSTMERIGIKGTDFTTLGASRLTSMSASEFAVVLRYISIAQQLRHAFQSIPEVSYASDQDRVHDLVTVYMTYLMDGRVIEFYENQRNTAKSLRDIIRNKQRFPQAEFRKVKGAFPCILAGVRDYAEYIPLEAEVFDLLVIDEASQVSIAQAFPALLRAKKILILGDKKQFSNVKAIQARSDTNREYLNRLEASFRRNVSRDPAKLVKLDRFNIRTSILEFFEFISNYHAQLLKHFRGYKELISYSNVSFYRNKLQVMKIRGKNINDVIRFTILPVSPNESDRRNRNTNQYEVQYIVSELLKLKEQGSKFSIGIITPHTDQQKLLVDRIGKLPEREYFYNELRMKIMTFDTCQGEERDLILYSMVANSEVDKLWGVFIKDLATVDLEEDGKLKAQRLNVGFSRARESVHFVLSKPLEGYNGAIGEALRHFWNIRAETESEHTATEVDPQSDREAEVLNWFYQTSFWSQEKERSEFTPQFELGRYLKQLDSHYEHPEYRVDF